MKRKLIIIGVVLFISACNHVNTIDVQNNNKGHLISRYHLEVTGKKVFKLDSITAPRAQYSQIFIDKNGERYFTFLNTNNNTIYYYSYDNQKFIKKVALQIKNIYKTVRPIGYFIKSKDSTYVYNMAEIEVLLADDQGVFYNRMSLIKGMNIKNPKWVSTYPQYYPKTTIPIIPTSQALLLPGQFFSTIPDYIISKFRYIAKINYDLGDLNYEYLYPQELYGHNYRWEGEFFTEVYVDYNQRANNLIFSFPVSHNLYISKLGSEKYDTVYAGSNVANAISSLSESDKNLSRKSILESYLKNDVYGAIKYDPYKKLYYRFLRRAITNINDKSQWQDKQLTLIILDENYKYLGETTLGTLKNWYVQDAFVTKEGLNIEFIENALNEDNLVIKILNIKKS